MGPQAQPLHTPRQVIDGVDVVVGQLQVLDVGQAKLLGPPPQARDRAISSTIGASSSTPVVRGGVSSSAVVREDQLFQGHVPGFSTTELILVFNEYLIRILMDLSYTYISMDS